MQPKGLDDPSMIDMVRLSPKEDRIELIMCQTRPWDGSARQVMALQEKWQNYVGFAIYGALGRKYPDYAQLPWRIVLDCQSEPDARIKEFIRRANEETAKQGGDFVIEYTRRK
ncbi:MAG TPA: DUF6572 domain-containing protein [Actinomycetota bacterium]|nr:DUF6572 domain-containing protein [Actinomycetota bacterium]